MKPQRITYYFCVIATFVLLGPWIACSEESPLFQENEWGIGGTVRFADIPFDTTDKTVGSFIPLMYYDGDRFFLNGIEGGFKAFSLNHHRIDILGRLRFFDIPRDYQNAIQPDKIDAGFRYRYSFTTDLTGDLDILMDRNERWHSNARLVYEAHFNRLDLSPYINLRYKSRKFNNYYFGLDQGSPGAGADFSLGLDGRFHIWDNIYLTGKLQTTWFEKDVRDLDFIRRDRVDELQLGFLVTNRKSRSRATPLSNTPYWRFSHGVATPEGLDKIFAGKGKIDPEHNQLTSVFYGHPLTDKLFGLPFDVYLTSGFLWHWRSDVQDSGQEYVVAMKAYYTIPTSVRWRVGAAEGISYVSDITYIEQQEMDKKGYEPSNLMNYLDFSIDINTGDLFGKKSMETLYFGYGLHHRSSIYESAAHFGRISGGSNYHTLYLQYHY